MNKQPDNLSEQPADNMAEVSARIEEARQAGATALVLSKQELTTLPASIGELTQLQHLDISDNELMTLPESISQLAQLQELNISNNQLTMLPESISQLTQLRDLNSSRNQLTTLPEFIGQLAQLQELRIWSNELTTLPASISRLTQLHQLDISYNQLTTLPEFIGQLAQLQELDISDNQLTTLPEFIGQLAQLQELNISYNQLTMLPESISQLTQLHQLDISGNQLTMLPEFVGQLAQLQELDISNNQLTTLPEFVGQLTQLRGLNIYSNGLTTLPESIGGLTQLHQLDISGNQLTTLPESFAALSNLSILVLGDSTGGLPLVALPDCVRQLTHLKNIGAQQCELASLPDWLGDIAELEQLNVSGNYLTDIPSSLGRLGNLKSIDLRNNPLNPALQSAYEQGLEATLSYLRSLETAEPLYEAKLVLVGEGGVGKTTLLKALSGREPRKNEPTTHGVSIDIHSMHLPHPDKEGVDIRFNAWDFGGQEVYRVTHQFFFSRRSVYLLVWEPRMGVQQCQVEDWLKLIRLRVGDDARVIIVSTHARTGQRIARIDTPVFLREYPSMIVDFIEVDSLTDDRATGAPVGIAALKTLIASAARDLEHMGMPFNVGWRAARDELIELGQTQPRVPYAELAAVCARHGLDDTDTRVLAHLMHDLGYIVYYGDDERMKDDVVLQPEWLTKAIGFVLEDRATQEREGVLPDTHLEAVWLKHPFADEPRYDPILYPFFLRLMEKYDVSYRLEDGTASLVAQHVPQVRPLDLPWLPGEEPQTERRRLTLVCVMDETPPGLVPWMIVRTHDYAYEVAGHRFHWQKGMFLRNKRHGEAMLELSEREFHLHAEAVWPEYFMNILRQTLSKLINDNWPGMQGRYSFSVPCRHRTNNEMCRGRFDINALSQFLEEGDDRIRCQVCRTRQKIVDLLYGFEDEEPRQQLARIEGKLERGFDTLQNEIAGLESRLANYVMAIMRAMANEAREGPRLFDIQPVGGNWRRPFQERYRLRLWCEAEGCQHPVRDEGKGAYEFNAAREWVKQVAPYAAFIAGMLKMLVPMIAPAVDVRFGPKTIEDLGLDDQLELMKEITGLFPEEIKMSASGKLRQEALSEDERSGLLALHALLRELDPQHARLGLRRVPTYTGDFLWLCQTHYELSQPRIPDIIVAGNPI